MGQKSHQKLNPHSELSAKQTASNDFYPSRMARQGNFISIAHFQHKEIEVALHDSVTTKPQDYKSMIIKQNIQV